MMHYAYLQQLWFHALIPKQRAGVRWLKLLASHDCLQPCFQTGNVISQIPAHLLRDSKFPLPWFGRCHYVAPTTFGTVGLHFNELLRINWNKSNIFQISPSSLYPDWLWGNRPTCCSRTNEIPLRHEFGESARYGEMWAPPNFLDWSIFKTKHANSLSVEVWDSHCDKRQGGIRSRIRIAIWSI